MISRDFNRHPIGELIRKFQPSCVASDMPELYPGEPNEVVLERARAIAIKKLQRLGKLPEHP